VDLSRLQYVNEYGEEVKEEIGGATKPGHCHRKCWGAREYEQMFADGSVADMHDTEAVAKLLLR
jgi:hypothetical protein